MPSNPLSPDLYLSMSRAYLPVPRPGNRVCAYGRALTFLRQKPA